MNPSDRSARWSDVVSADAALFEARRRFLAGGNVDDELRHALTRATDRGAALRLLMSLDVSLIIGLITELVSLASVAHADISLVRQVVGRIPGEWAEAYLWDFIEPVLEQGGGEEYRRLAELLRGLDSEHLGRLVSRAAASNDEEIREVAEDFAS